MMPPCIRTLGFILVLLSFLANIPVLFHYTNVYILILLLTGLIYFGGMTFYTWKFLFIDHYMDEEKTNISVIYISMIQDKFYERIRLISFVLYIIIYLFTLGFSTYLPNVYSELSNWQKTMFAYNYAVSSFTIMYFYEHKFMNKYLSLSNVVIHNSNDSSFISEDERLIHYDETE